MVKLIKLIKEIYCFVKKSYGPKVALFLLLFIILVIISFYLGRSDLFRDNKASVSSTIEANINSKKNEDLKENCDGGIFEDNIDKWIIKYYDNPDEDGFYCPRSKDFFSPDIWYGCSVPTNFESFKIRYKIKNKKDDVEDPPVFIFSIGENPRILRFYIAERNPEIIGFEKIVIKDSKFDLERVPVKYLDYPIEFNGDIELTVRIIINRENKVTFLFNLNYISEYYNKPTEADFSYEVDLLDPNIESELSNLDFGFGTVRGSCVKPISYKICY